MFLIMETRLVVFASLFLLPTFMFQRHALPRYWHVESSTLPNNKQLHCDVKMSLEYPEGKKHGHTRTGSRRVMVLYAHCKCGKDLWRTTMAFGETSIIMLTLHSRLFAPGLLFL